MSAYYMRILPETLVRSIPPKTKTHDYCTSPIMRKASRAIFPLGCCRWSFLELVRYGIRKADDPTIVSTVKVIER